MGKDIYVTAEGKECAEEPLRLRGWLDEEPHTNPQCVTNLFVFFWRKKMYSGIIS